MKLKFKDGTVLALGYNRIISSEAGSYYELRRDHILLELESKFKQKLHSDVSNEGFDYYWLVPKGRNEKIYWQIHTVHYADYVPGLYYISTKLVTENNGKETN